MNSQRDFEVLADNLRLIENKKDDLSMVLLGQFREAALLLSSETDETGIAELYSAISEGGTFGSPRFALFCSEYCQTHKKSISLQALLQMDEAEGTPDTERTVYLKNVSADRAYRIFSTRLKGITSAYSSGYSAACEEVYYGKSAYAILPMYNSKDGSLLSFRRMLKKYDLKICCACSVETDEEDFVLYALVRKGIASESGDYLDMSVVLPDEVSISAFLVSCEIFGLKPLLINSVPLEYGSDSLGKHELILHFSCAEADMRGFLLFLEASHIRYIIEGIYNIIK